MDKSAIKNFAVGARVKIKEQIEQKAYTFGITKDEIKIVKMFEDTFEVNSNKYNKRLLKHRENLVKKINQKGFDQVIEEVSYTWFNRLIAIRFMEVNEYLPSGVRVLSSTDNSKAEPDIIREAVNLDFENLNVSLIYRLQDENNSEELFKYLLIKQCNELGKIMPVVFEEIEDFTELLLPDKLLQEGSIIRELVTSIAEDDWKEQVEIIGWLYQYYISEKKDEVFADLKKNIKITKENIPAATQLFTPDWIVKYMVENSLGRLWLESHPNEELKAKWKYYLEDAEQEPEVQKHLEKIKEKNKDLKPEDIKVIDPCMGSGHILVYKFDLLYDIYKSAGYSEREIPKLILTKNLYGLDIDDRAAQLAYFAVMMKARSYNRRIFRERMDLNICSIQESNDFPKEAIDFLVNSMETEIEKRIHRGDVEYLISIFNDAKEYGSIIEVKKIDFDAIEARVEEIKNGDTADIFELQYKNVILEKIPELIKQAKIMSRKYDAVVTNPPFMGNKGINEKLKQKLEEEFKDENRDLFAVFIKRCLTFAELNKYVAMITMESWMFLSTFQKLRQKIVNEKTIRNLVHMPYDGKGKTSLGISFGTSAFVISNSKIQEYMANYSCIRYYEIDSEGVPYEFPVNNERKCNAKSENFHAIPQMPIAYWISNNSMKIFNDTSKLNDYGKTKQGLATGENDTFLRKWFEVKFSCIGFDLSDRNQAKNSTYKWFPCNKGGEYKKWYGNNEYVVNWYNDGEEIRNFKDKSGKLKSRPQNIDFYFKRGLTWSTLSSKGLSVRYSPNGFVFETKGSMYFTDNDKLLEYILAFMNSKLGENFINIISPTMDFHEGPISQLPLKVDKVDEISDLSKSCIEISKCEWDSNETSWNFKEHPLLNYSDCRTNIKIAFDDWVKYSHKQYIELKKNEEEINKLFLDIYNMKNEITYEVDEKFLSISLYDNISMIKSFMSYVVGCMFGRYSLDHEGLVYAGGHFNPENYKTFKVDSDNVIPITDNEYFEDDIVSRFIEFIKITFSEEKLEGNLDFIAVTLGKKGNETSRQTIRRYLLKDFYKDHLQTYKKKPIYWLFDSGKNDGFKALVYMHRYDIGTVARVRTDYLHLLQRKYEAEVNRLDMVMENSNDSLREKTESKKKKEKIQKQIFECVQYDQVIAHVANQKISIDLDDGVSVNYGKFQGVEVPQGEGKKPLKADLLAKI